MIVIPTRLDRPTVWPLIEEARQVGPVVIVHTTDTPDVPDTITVRSTARNIHTWWNAGLDHCGDKALVLNDDIIATSSMLQLMVDALETADVVYLAGHRVGHVTPLTGWCYGIRPDKIRPDEQFGWWYGDDDLYLRAQRDGLRITPVNSAIVHARGPVAFENPEHPAMVERDAALYHSRWG